MMHRRCRQGSPLRLGRRCVIAGSLRFWLLRQNHERTIYKDALKIFNFQGILIVVFQIKLSYL